MVVGGRYRLIRFIARGGQADVHEAQDEARGVRVAVKMLRAAHERDQETIQRFQREVLLAARIEHRNVARVYTFDIHRGTDGRDIAFIAMELLPGETLHQRRTRLGRLSPDEALPIVAQIAEGLAAAHERNVVHRDLKPGNVILVPDDETERVVVTDFGLARPIAGEGLQSLTATGETVGTPIYMAPEQVRGARVTQAADLYALGVLMFELVTGRLPFGEDPSMAAQLDKLLEPAPSARRFAPGLPAAWTNAIARCLEIAPAKRFATTREVTEALRAPAHRSATKRGILGRLRGPGAKR